MGDVGNERAARQSAVGRGTPVWLGVPRRLVLASLVPGVFAVALLSLAAPEIEEAWAVQSLAELPDVIILGEFGRPTITTELGKSFIAGFGNPRPRSVRLGTRFPRQSISLLTRIRHCPAVFLEGNQFVDEDLAVLRKLNGLMEVNFAAPRLTSAGFQSLAELPLEGVVFRRMSVPEGALAVIARLPSLNYAIFVKATISDEDFAAFRNHATLKSLNFQETKLTSRSWDTITTLTSLDTLVLRETGVNNAQLQRLPASLATKFLALNGEEITDEGLTGLRADPELLLVDGSGITFGESTETWLKTRKRCRRIRIAAGTIPPSRIQYLNTLGPAQLYEDDQSPGGGLPSP